MKLTAIRRMLSQYWKDKISEFYQNIFTGIGTSAIIIFTLDLYNDIIQGKGLIIFSVIFVTLVPLLSNLVSFFLLKKYKLTGKLYQLQEHLNVIGNSGLIFQQRYAISRLNAEIARMTNLSKNTLLLPSFQKFEYIRLVLGIVLHEVMDTGDHYLTLSSLDFWTAQPMESSFMNDNLLAVNSEEKTINRIIVSKADLLLGDDALGDTKVEYERLKSVASTFKRSSKDKTFYSNFKNLFYFVEDYENWERYLLSVVVVRKDFSELLIIKVENWSHTDVTNPQIYLRYFPLNPQFLPDYLKDRLKNKLNIKDRINVIKLTQDLYDCMISHIHEDGGTNDTAFIIDYLRNYKDAFINLEDRYSTNSRNGEKKPYNPDTFLFDAEDMNLFLDSKSRRHN